MVLSLEEAFISMCRSSRVKVFISIAKLNDRCFCYVTAAMFVPKVTNRGLHTKLYKFGWHTFAYSTRPDSWLFVKQSSIIYPRFLNLFIGWLRFVVLITWLMKTENTIYNWNEVDYPHFVFLSFFLSFFLFCTSDTSNIIIWLQLTFKRKIYRVENFHAKVFIYGVTRVA